MVVEEAEEPLLHEGYQDSIMLSCHFDCSISAKIIEKVGKELKAMGKELTLT